MWMLPVGWIPENTRFFILFGNLFRPLSYGLQRLFEQTSRLVRTALAITRQCVYPDYLRSFMTGKTMGSRKRVPIGKHHCWRPMDFVMFPPQLRLKAAPFRQAQENFRYWQARRNIPDPRYILLRLGQWTRRFLRIRLTEST